MILMSFDIDWAPDFAIEYVVRQLVEHKVKATWFVTHQTRSLDLLRSRGDLFELGIHPNFLPHSTHGKSNLEILTHCLDLVPEAKGCRTHCLLQSTPLLAEIIESTTLEYDASLFVPGQFHLAPTYFWWREKKLKRIPFFWEDDLYMQEPSKSWKMDIENLARQTGLKVFNFHPLHIWLNSKDVESYKKLKAFQPKLQSLSERDSEVFRNPSSKQGCGNFFENLIQYVSSAK